MPRSLRHELLQDIAFARANLGMSRVEFMSQTPAEWSEVYAAWVERERLADRRTARVCMVLAWCHGDGDASEESFMPRTTLADEQQDDEGILSVLDGIGAANTRNSNG